jgi:CubicO group peptidase (beta-lactamase class C family)
MRAINFVFSAILFFGACIGGIVALVIKPRSHQLQAAAASGSSPSSSVLNADIRAHIETLVRQNGIPGYAVAVVRAGVTTEFGAWGNRTEAGDKVDENVRLLSILQSSLLKTPYI